MLGALEDDLHSCLLTFLCHDEYAESGCKGSKLIQVYARFFAFFATETHNYA